MMYIIFIVRIVHFYTRHILYSTVASTVQDGCSPLYAASLEGHSQTVDILLLKGADPNLTNKVCGLVWPFHLLHVYCVLVH